MPIRVHTPPICAANDIGISTRDGGVLVLEQTVSATGRKVATSAVFFYEGAERSHQQA